MIWTNDHTHWGLISILIHWMTAVIVFGLFGLGLWMVELDYYHEWYRKGPNLHKSMGVLLLMLTLFRLLWVSVQSRPLPLEHYTPIEKRLSKWVHHALYLLLLAIMFSGYLISTADGRAVEVFGLFSIPATISGIEHQEDIAGEVHLVLAVTLIALVVMHASAAVKHHWLDKDVTLKRMLGLVNRGD